MSYPPNTGDQQPWPPRDPRDPQDPDGQQSVPGQHGAPNPPYSAPAQPAYPTAPIPGSPSPQASGPQNPYQPQQPSQNPYQQQPTQPQQPPQNPYQQQPTPPQQPAQSPYPQQPQQPVPTAYPQQPTTAYPTVSYGTTGPQQATAAGYPQTDPAWGKPPKKKRRGRAAIWIAAAVVLVLLVAGGIVGGVIGTQANAPEREVEEYLSALVDGDAEDALSVSGADADDADVLLTDDVYADIDDRISGYELGETTISGDTAEVAVAISQGDETYDTTFTLEKAGKAFVVFDTWRLQAPELGVVSYTVTGPPETAVSVSGVDTSALEPAESGAVELRALPGTYTVALASDDDFFAAEPLTVSVVGFGEDAVTSTTSDGSESSALTVTLTEGAIAAGQEAVDAYLDGCAASTDFRPDGCPFTAQGETPGYEYTNCVWTLDPRPAFTIGEFADGQWPVSTDSSGTASLECDVRDPSTGATGTATAGPMDVEIAGAITAFGEDGATYTP